MVSQWLVGVGLAAVMAVETAEKPDLAGYEAAKASVGRDAQAQVKLALWCEAHGLSAERVKHLALAVLSDPKNVTARGLLGLVEYRDRWVRPELVSQKVKSDEALTAKLAEYNARRAKVGRSVDEHWKLGLWCEEVGLDAEAKAHFSTVTRLEPSRDLAWKRLGYKKVGNRWVTDEQMTAEKAEADAQKKADLHWKPLLTRWHGWLRDKDKSRRERAAELLTTVTDPCAVPTLMSIFGTGEAGDQDLAVKTLGQIEAGGSSRALAYFSVFGKSPEVRRAAAETLKRRDPRDFIGLLIGLIRDPMKYEVKPGKNLGEVGELFVEGKRYNVRRVYGLNATQITRFPLLPVRFFDSSVPYDPFSIQNLETASASATVAVTNGRGGMTTASNLTVLAARRDLQIAQQQAQQQFIINASQQQLASDINAVEAYNADAGEVDARVLPVLSAVTGQEATGTSDDWNKWWADQQGYVYDPPSTENKPTLNQFVTNPFLPATHTACFAAGTPVRTRDGLKPIESIQVGDQVLSQDTKTGRLSFVPVLAVFHNKPSGTLKVGLSETKESIVATGIHRFWKSGQGWVMARDLKVGDVLRTVGGTAKVSAVEPQAIQPVFNLEVGASQSYFVGTPGVLVHDNSLVQPTNRPFDAEPELAQR